MRRDSNPRKAQTFNGFQDRRIQPLCHSSFLSFQTFFTSGLTPFQRFCPSLCSVHLRLCLRFQDRRIQPLKPLTFLSFQTFFTSGLTPFQRFCPSLCSVHLRLCLRFQDRRIQPLKPLTFLSCAIFKLSRTTSRFFNLFSFIRFFTKRQVCFL